jgi:hypothetical protein
MSDPGQDKGEEVSTTPRVGKTDANVPNEAPPMDMDFAPAVADDEDTPEDP